MDLWVLHRALQLRAKLALLVRSLHPCRYILVYCMTGLLVPQSACAKYGIASMCKHNREGRWSSWLITITPTNISCVHDFIHTEYLNLLVPYFPEYKSHFLSRNLLKIFDMQLILRMQEKGALLSISCMCVPTCSTSGSLGVTGGSMATRRCSYTAAFKLKLVEYAERHGNHCAQSPESGLSQCGECAR